MSKPCLYCGDEGSCCCTYRHMRKGSGGVEMYNTHPQKAAAVKETITEMVNRLKDDREYVFKFSITRTKDEKLGA
jgi:hypothetical protein